MKNELSVILLNESQRFLQQRNVFKYSGILKLDKRHLRLARPVSKQNTHPFRKLLCWETATTLHYVSFVFEREEGIVIQTSRATAQTVERQDFKRECWNRDVKRNCFLINPQALGRKYRWNFMLPPGCSVSDRSSDRAHLLKTSISTLSHA